MHMLSKEQRLFTIREIIGTTAVQSQDELRRLLKRRGASVTQATLSRDMHEIGVVRVNSPDGGRYTLPSVENLPLPGPTLGAQVLAMTANEALIVIQTVSGSASIVAEFIDRQKLHEIIGTVAGDNTVLVVPRSVRKVHEVLEILKTTLIKGND